MKNKLTVLAMLLVVFFGGLFGLSGCADKYENLKINIFLVHTSQLFVNFAKTNIKRT